MNCKKCGEEIPSGQRAVEVSYGMVYTAKGMSYSDIVGDYFEYYHIKCFESIKKGD